MRTLFVLAAVAVFATGASAKVWTTIYRHDEKTPLEASDPNHPTVYRDIMAGTHLTIVIRSDTGGYWFGGLIVDGESISHGRLEARGLVDKPQNYAGSCLYAAGDDAWIGPLIGPQGHGFQFSSTPAVPWYRAAVPGDWFLLDYHAERTGSCKVELYDFDLDFLTPVETPSFTHVPTRDFNADSVVDLKDFSLLASRWRTAPTPDPNDPGAAMDLDADGSVDLHDLAQFCDFWLERTDGPKAVADPSGS